MMLGLSVADSVPSSWDVPDAEVSDAEISDPEQPARSKAAEHARITSSILPDKDSPPLIGVTPALPEAYPTPCSVSSSRISPSWPGCQRTFANAERWQKVWRKRGTRSLFSAATA